MRVSTLAIFNRYEGNIIKRENKIEKYSQILSSGKKIINPSDAPVQNDRILKLKSLQSRIDGYIKNIDNLTNNQELATATFDNLAETAQEGRVEIVQLLNIGVFDEEDANIIDKFLQDIKKYMITEANKKVGDTYLFSGESTTTKPFSEDGTYNGSTKETEVPVAHSIQMNINFNGKEKLGVYNIEDIASGTQKEQMAIIATIDKIHEIIQSKDLSQLHKPQFKIDGKEYTVLELFDTGYNKILQERSLLGTQMKTAQDIKEQHQFKKLTLNELTSKLEDADFTKVISDLQKSQVSYQALLAVFSQNKQISLLNYM